MAHLQGAHHLAAHQVAVHRIAPPLDPLVVRHQGHPVDRLLAAHPSRKRLFLNQNPSRNWNQSLNQNLALNPSKRNRNVGVPQVVDLLVEEGLLHEDLRDIVGHLRKSLFKPNNLKQRHLMRLLPE